jgi:hypothetical protein
MLDINRLFGGMILLPLAPALVVVPKIVGRNVRVGMGVMQSIVKVILLSLLDDHQPTNVV